MTGLFGNSDPLVKDIWTRYEKAMAAKGDQRSLEAQLQSAVDRIQHHREELDACDNDIEQWNKEVETIKAKLDKAQTQRARLQEQIREAERDKDKVIGELSTTTAPKSDQDAVKQCLRVFGLAVPEDVPPKLKQMFDDVQALVARLGVELKAQTEAADPGRHQPAPGSQQGPPHGQHSTAAAAAATPRVRKQPTEDEDDTMESGRAMPSKMRKAQTTSIQSQTVTDKEEDNEPLAALAPRAQCS